MTPLSVSPLPLEEVQAGARRFKKLRLSLVSSCNFSCVYCVHDGKPHKAASETPVKAFTTWVQAIHQQNPIEKIRLTGGEPTLYSGLIDLVRELNAMGAFEVAMTTNGHALTQLAAPLKEAGLSSVNISLDAVDEKIFRAMGGRAYAHVLSGVEAAQEAGLEVKINMTLVNELNETQILPMLHWARAKGVVLRYLELMKMGHLHSAQNARLVASKQILETIQNEFSVKSILRAPHDTAHYYELPDGYRFGIIGNTSLPFCTDCDRLRLDSQGRVFGCLSNARSYSLADAHGPTDISAILAKAMALKQSERFTGSALVMRDIGG